MTSAFATRAATGISGALATALLLAFAPTHAAAQGTEIDPSGPVDVGPLVLHPTIGWQTEYEDNVFRSADRPVSDIVSTIGGKTEARGRLRRIGLTASGAADWVQYAKLRSERGGNVGATVKLDLLLNRIVPYVSSSYSSSRRRSNLEIDSRPRIEQSSVGAGGVFRLGGKTAMDFSARRVKTAYAEGDASDGVILSEALNQASDDVTLSIIQDVTPLSRFLVAAELNRNQFDASSFRNADIIRLMTGFESDGRIRGRGRAGIGILRPHDRTLPETRGLYLSLGTSATIVDSLRLSIDAERNTSPSYRSGVAYYEYYGYSGSIAYAIRRSLKISVLAGRRVADYRAGRGALTLPLDEAGVDDEKRYGTGISFLFGESMLVDFTGAYMERTSISAQRRFDGVSLRAGISHAF